MSEKKLKWVDFSIRDHLLFYAWEDKKIGYQIGKHGEDEGGKTGYRLRIYRIEPGVPTLFGKNQLPDLQTAKDAAEVWRTENKERLSRLRFFR